MDNGPINAESVCKQEQEDHIPIIEINSVYSMAAPNHLAERQVTWQQLIMTSHDNTQHDTSHHCWSH